MSLLRKIMLVKVKSIWRTIWLMILCRQILGRGRVLVIANGR